MTAKSDFTPAYVAGFVQRCFDLGMDANTTEAEFQKHAFNMMLATPAIYEGFRAGMQGAAQSTGITKSAMAKHVAPARLALVVEMRVKYASDELSKGLRKEMGLPEPTWETIPDDLKAGYENLVKYASMMHGIDQLSSMPLNQKMLLASLFGGTAGGVLRSLSPTETDTINRRGAINRFARGGMHGALTGSGAMAGAMAGNSLMQGGQTSRGLQGAGMIGGGLAGGYLGNSIGRRFLS